MMRFNHEADWVRLCRAARCRFVPGFDQCVATMRGDTLLGGVLLTDYNEGGSIHMHTAGFLRGWLTRELLHSVFAYAFIGVRVRKVIVTIHEHNLPSLTFASKLGFVVETQVRDVFKDGALIIMGMYRPQCRYLEPPYGKVHTVA